MKSKSSYVQREMDKILKMYTKNVDDLDNDIESKHKVIGRSKNANIRGSRRKPKNSRSKGIKGPNELPLRDKNGRFISSKNIRNAVPHTRSVKVLPKPGGIANRLRKRPQPLSSKQTPKAGEKRMTRSMVRFFSSNSNSKAASKREESKSGKKRYAKSIEKDISLLENDNSEDRKLNQEVLERKISLKSKRVPIYQEYDDFLKRRRKDKRVEFFRTKRELGEEVLSAAKRKQLVRYCETPGEDTF